MTNCLVCKKGLTEKESPLTTHVDTFYCEECDIYWIEDENGVVCPYCFLEIPSQFRLLTEGVVSDAPQMYGLKVSLDSREQIHKNTPHFHIYYGNERSVGYKIEDLSPLDTERNPELRRMYRFVVRFIEDIRSWMPKANQKDPSMTNKEYMLDRYKLIVSS